MDVIANLEKMIHQGRDSAVLRFSLGSAYFQNKAYGEAIGHLEQALQLDPRYSAAWKTLGKVLHADGQAERARSVFVEGIRVAEERGDIQAVKEMQVFLKRIDKVAG